MQCPTYLPTLSGVLKTRKKKFSMEEIYGWLLTYLPEE